MAYTPFALELVQTKCGKLTFARDLNELKTKSKISVSAYMFLFLYPNSSCSILEQKFETRQNFKILWILFISKFLFQMLQRKLKTDILNGINNDSVIEVSWLYCIRHPQLFPFRESTPVCSRMFCLLAFRQTRPALQNLDLGFLKKRKKNQTLCSDNKLSKLWSKSFYAATW